MSHSVNAKTGTTHQSTPEHLTVGARVTVPHNGVRQNGQITQIVSDPRNGRISVTVRLDATGESVSASHTQVLRRA
ncbi:hypothetical protein AURDEDRAFT_162234 [Auricularia subglabra TFB-10046 SS5]|nr:hypothetical protein AURDEDRAFT_162234 [Auricularia subglabra TFB-10046 SS5]